MNAHRWLTHLRGLGVPGSMGLVLIVIGAWVQMQWLPVQHTQVDAMASDVRRLRHDLQAGAAPSGAVGGAGRALKQPWDVSDLPADQAWQAVWETLPDETQRVSLLRAVTSSAHQLGVMVPSVQYRGTVEPWSSHQSQALWRERMTMPIEGRYGDVRAWLGTLLNQPNLSVDTLDLNRADTSTDQVKGRVSLSLWWRTSAGRKP